MSRFTRFSRISPLALCQEQERRAWRCAAALLLPFLAGALGALFCPVPPGREAGMASFSGVVVQGESAGQEAGAAAVAAPPLPPAAVPAVALVPGAPPAVAPDIPPPAPLAWEAPVLEPDAPLLACELPARLAAAPRTRSQPAPASSRAEAGGAEAPPGELVAARYRSTPLPPYPPSLLNSRRKGVVGLRVFIDAEGVPKQVDVTSSSGHAAFDREARAWVLARWRFYPARRGGEAVASVVQTRVAFVLR